MSERDEPKNRGEGPAAQPAAAPVDRRRVLLRVLGGVTAAGGALVGYSEGRAAWERRKARLADAVFDEVAPRVPDRPPVVGTDAKLGARRRLGRTGLLVAPVGVGAGGLADPRMLARAVDRGMNYVDTSICYGNSEEVIGRAIKDSPSLRDALVIATKWDPGPRTPKGVILESLDRSLTRLRVDAIDVMQIHWLGGEHTRSDNGFDRLENPELYEAMELAKKAGKVKFFGATSHHENRGKILMRAIDKGVFDVLLVKMNVLEWEHAGIPALLAEAKARDVGVVAMKSQPSGGRIPKGFEKAKWNIYQSNLRWSLQHDVACVVESGIGTQAEKQDQAIAAAAEAFTGDDARLLRTYAQALSPEHCRGCGSFCEGACPEGVLVAPVLHYGMYARDYGWRAYAKELYADLPAARRWSDRCLECDACSKACPFGIDVPARLAEARSALG